MVEDAGGLGVGGVVHLETAVEDQPVDAVAAHPATDPVGGLQQGALATRPPTIGRPRRGPPARRPRWRRRPGCRHLRTVLAGGLGPPPGCGRRRLWTSRRGGVAKASTLSPCSSQAHQQPEPGNRWTRGRRAGGTRASPQQATASPTPETTAPPRPPALSGHLSWRALGPTLWRCAEAGTGEPRLRPRPHRSRAAPRDHCRRAPREGVERPSGRPAQARLIPGRPVVDADGVGWVVHDDPGGLPPHDPAAGRRARGRFWGRGPSRQPPRPTWPGPWPPCTGRASARIGRAAGGVGRCRRGRLAAGHRRGRRHGRGRRGRARGAHRVRARPAGRGDRRR